MGVVYGNVEGCAREEQKKRSKRKAKLGEKAKEMIMAKKEPLENHTLPRPGRFLPPHVPSSSRTGIGRYSFGWSVFTDLTNHVFKDDGDVDVEALLGEGTIREGEGEEKRVGLSWVRGGREGGRGEES